MNWALQIPYELQNQTTKLNKSSVYNYEHNFMSIHIENDPYLSVHIVERLYVVVVNDSTVHLLW